LAAVAAAVLAIMMFLMAADVICRYFFNAPIPGSLELVEFMMAILVPFGIAYCALRRSHVTVDMIVDGFPSPVRRVIEIFTTTIAVLFLGVLCWQNILNIFDSYHSHMTSAVLKLPAYPFVVPVTVGMGLFALILVIHLLFKNSKEASDGAS
jgi:TRAP-type C4-dicarboxylate transport system permease small subunit